MASGFGRPSLSELISRIATDLISRLGTYEFEMRRSLPGVLSRVWSESVNGLYAFIEYLAGEFLPDTAKIWLDRHASIWGISRIAAKFAAGNIRFTGSNGTIVPQGTVLRRGDGVEYITTTLATVADGEAVAAIRCLTAGLTGNMDAGTVLSLVSPIAGLSANGTIETGGLTGGAEAEGDEALRARLLDRIRQPPHGGADFDYVKWAKAFSATITRVWVYPLEAGLGTVTVRFMMDDTYDDGIPQADDVNAMKAHLEALRPVTVELHVGAPNAVPLDFVFTKVEPDTPAVRAAIEAELRDLIRREATARGGVPNTPDGKLYISRLREAVSLATGERNYVMASPNDDVQDFVQPDVGEIFVMGGITWP